MKKNIKILLLILVMTKGFSQKTELKICLNSGLFHFSGESAEAISQFNLSSDSNLGYTNNPYGTKSGFSYGLSLNLQRVNKINLIFGVNTGFQANKSKIIINSVFGYDGTNAYNKSVIGQTFIINRSLFTNPFIGYRFEINKIPIDIVGGINFDYILNTKEIGNARDSNNIKYSTSIDRKTITIDVSPKIQLATEFKKFGFIIGYSTGLVNYREGFVGGTNNVHSKNSNFGITYKLK
ncbi:hypothetical protein [Flavobacterium crassostreae]|uniref:Outer membrane protein beta-barrel domain-containing protein n=1 Tax=Flavobacterium crassostreae TaxID=1763534 RepID=A0A1B9DQ49_9FLAO|nr:hypothetical protein [Flavobacterium crassostreae]OCB71805.1 hypothetical protein LPBF_11375 [Flavobacterium crassostreae]